MRPQKPALRLALLCVLLLAPLALTAQAPATVELDPRLGTPENAPLSGPALDALTHEVASVIRCPVCQGLSVADSPATSAVAMKEEVRRLLAAGYSGDQVLTYFETSYGEFIRLEPKATGFNLVVWIAPLAFLLIGAVLIGLRVRSSRGPLAAHTDGTDPSVDSPSQDDSNDSDNNPDRDPSLEAYRQRVRKEVSQ